MTRNMTFFIKLLLICTLSSLLTGLLGCVQLQPYKTELQLPTLPNKWEKLPETKLQETVAPEKLPHEQGWLRTFNDAALELFIQQALQNNVDIRSAVARVNMAKNNLAVTSADKLPSVGAGIQASRSGRETPAGISRTTSSTYSGSFDVSWEVDIWGKLNHRVSAGEYEYLAAESDLKQAHFSLAANITKHWFNAIEASLQVKLAEDTLRSFQQSHEIISQGYNDGLNSPLDVHLAMSSVANSESRLSSEIIRRDTIIRNLQILAAAYPDGKLTLPSLLPDLNSGMPANLPSELLSRRPDIQSALLRLNAADERSSEAQLNRLPRFSLSSSTGTSSAELKNLLDWDTLLWRLATNITAPIFQGGRLYAAQQVAIAKSDEALQNYTQTILTALLEVETSLFTEPHLNDQQQALTRASESAAASQQLAKEQYAEGLVDIITLLDTQRRVFDSQRALLSIQNQRLQNRINLYLALGGDFADLNAKIKNTRVEKNR